MAVLWESPHTRTITKASASRPASQPAHSDDSHEREQRVKEANHRLLKHTHGERNGRRKPHLPHGLRRQEVP